MTKRRGIQAVVLGLALAMGPFAARPAQASSKDIIELQTQVQQLIDMVQRLQSTMDTKYGMLQHLVEQAADNTNQLNAAFNALQLKITSQNDALTGKLDTASGQTQSVNDSLDELKSRLDKLNKQMQDMQAQLQTMQTQMAAAAQPPAANATAAPGAPAPPTQGTQPAATDPAPQANTAPPLQDTYQAGLRDYNAAHYVIAESEFQDVIHYYPLDQLAGNAEFYLGEISYRQKNYESALKHYNVVLEKFEGSSNEAAAQLHKSYSLLALKKRESAIHELKALIQRHPQAPEADQARRKLAVLEGR